MRWREHPGEESLPSASQAFFSEAAAQLGSGLARKKAQKAQKAWDAGSSARGSGSGPRQTRPKSRRGAGGTRKNDTGAKRYRWAGHGNSWRCSQGRRGGGWWTRTTRTTQVLRITRIPNIPTIWLLEPGDVFTERERLKAVCCTGGTKLPTLLLLSVYSKKCSMSSKGPAVRAIRKSPLVRSAGAPRRPAVDKG